MEHVPPSLAVVGHAALHDTAMMPLEELGALRDRQPNVLIVGNDAAVEAILAEMRPFLQAPVIPIWLAPGQPLQMPASLDAGTTGTVVLRHLDALGAAEQRRLAEWLARRAGFVQVVTTCGAPLLPLVEQGRFSDVLYYRLNTLYIDAGSL
jgi:hypothetical protein